MKRLFVFLLFILLTLSVTAQTVSFNGVKQDVVIDVRTAPEYQAGHIAGAVNVPLNEIETGIYRLRDIHKKSHILVYCRSGRRSAVARNILIKQGFQHVYDGGAFHALEPKLQACSTKSC